MLLPNVRRKVAGVAMSDLISRKALMQFPIRINNYDKENGNENFVLGIESVLEFAKYLPAVDAVEVVHAEWINRPKTCVFVCSVCGREIRTFHTNRVEEAESEFPYCHCGAKMDKRRESEGSE